MFFLLCLLGHSMNSRTNGITVRWFMQHACGHCQGLHFSHTNLDLVQQTGLSDQRGNNNLSNHVLQRGSEEREEWLTEKTHFLPPTTPLPPKKRDTTFYELTSKFPLAFFNTPWVRDTAKSQSVLKVRKRTKKKKKSRDNYELAATQIACSEKDNCTLINDDSLHSFFQLVCCAQAFDRSTQHPLLLRQPALQSGNLNLQQLILRKEIRNEMSICVEVIQDILHLLGLFYTGKNCKSS